MALTLAAHLSATVVDELGTEASTLAYVMLDPTQTLATLATAAGAWATDLDAVLGGQIRSLRVQLTPALPGGIKSTPDAGSRVEQTAVLNLSNATSPHRFGMALPSVSDSTITAGKLDLTNAAVAALITLLTTATGTQAYANSAQQVVTGLVDAILSFRKRRRQLARSSFEL